MSGKDEGFVPAVPRREKKDKKAKQPKQEKPQQQPKETKPEKPAEESKPAINENTVICNVCFKIGHKSDSCPEKKGKSDINYCNKCGKAGHRGTDCKVTLEMGCFYCGESSHTYHRCPQREKILFESDGVKRESYVICRNCGCLGHLSHECKEPVQRRQLCFRCGEVGHSTKDCPKPEEDPSVYRVCRHCGEIGHFASECKVPNIQHPDVCPLCGQIGHTVDECPSDMPSESKPVEKKPEQKAPKKTMKSADLKDTEQFPAL